MKALTSLKGRSGAAAATLAVSLVASAASAQVPAGGEFMVPTTLWGDQMWQSVAMEPDGDFVAVWSSGWLFGTDREGVFGQRFDAAGVRRGGEFLVNSLSTPLQEYMSGVAVGNKGDFVVVWSGGTFGPGRIIKGRRYDAAGAAVGSEFDVNTAQTWTPSPPRVGLAADGTFVAAWVNQGIDGRHAIARRFDAAGRPASAEFALSNNTIGTQMSVDLGVEADGRFVAVWEDCCDRDGDGTAIMGQRFDASGGRIGTEFIANGGTSGNQNHPSLSLSPAGGFAVAWQGPASTVIARRFDAGATPIGNDFIVNSSTPASGVFLGDVAHDTGGNFVVSWWGAGDGSYGGAFAQRFSPSGARRGAEFGVNSYTTSFQGEPVVTSDAVGNFVVVWESYGQDGSYTGLFAQRFGGLGPAALRVDSGGNGVLEPGETVSVRPTWGNLSGAAQTFSGALTAITGPAGGVYTVLDGSAGYGVVADHTSAECIDCYSVSVAAASGRPALHWDASAVESILPDAQGQQKQWTLHVGESFTDVPPASLYYASVETLVHHGVTGGCSMSAPELFCPAAPLTRGEAAVVLVVAKEGRGFRPPKCTGAMFADVPNTNPLCGWIEEMARRGVGSDVKEEGVYRPSHPTRRDEMAMFVLQMVDRALRPPPCVPPNLYSDVPETDPACPWIEELTNRGAASGCGGGRYCPAAAITREEMARFVANGFGLSLYGP